MHVKFKETKYGTSSCVLHCAQSASSCNRFAPKPANAAFVDKIGPGGVHKWRKGKAESNFHPSQGHLHRQTCKHVIPLDIQQHVWKVNPKVLHFCFILVFMLRQETVLRSTIWVLMLFFGKNYSAMAISFGTFSCWMLVLYIGRDGKRPSVVFLHSAWRLWRWQSSAANASQRAGFYRQLSKIFMSAARAELKRRIFCATIRERWALYPILPVCGAAWPCFQTTLLLNVTLL